MYIYIYIYYIYIYIGITYVTITITYVTQCQITFHDTRRSYSPTSYHTSQGLLTSDVGKSALTAVTFWPFSHVSA